MNESMATGNRLTYQSNGIPRACRDNSTLPFHSQPSLNLARCQNQDFPTLTIHTFPADLSR